VKTAGSFLLLLQAIFLPLCLAQGSSKVTPVGGTHVPWSPPFHYFSKVLLPTLEPMGISVDATIEEWGFYPRGGGKIQLNIEPAYELKPIRLTDRGSLKKIWGLSTLSSLPRHMAERQRDQAIKRIKKKLNMEPEINILYDASSNEPGSFLFLLAEHEKAIAGFSSLGKKGKQAEKVADEAVDDLKDYLRSGGCIDPHLTDQLVPFMALTRGNSSFTTTRITDHLLTNLWIISYFLQVKIEKQGEIEKTGRVDFIPPTY
jgi:RNA 3'-terminal phosphate cyclase (ATP)